MTIPNGKPPMASPPPFTRTTVELQTLKHELQRLKVHLIAHLRSKGIPIVVPSTTTKEPVTGPRAVEGECKTIVVETKIDNAIEEDDEEAGAESNEKSLLLSAGMTMSSGMTVEQLPRSLQPTSSSTSAASASSSSSSSSKNSSTATSDHNELPDKNSNRATAVPLLLHQQHHHQQHHAVQPVCCRQSPVRQGCLCCGHHGQRWTQFVQYLSQCQTNITFCRGNGLRQNDSSNSNDDQTHISSSYQSRSWITSCFNYMFG